jgi:hypothetical protein
VVRHVDVASSVPEPDGVASNVVPFGTATQSPGAGSATSVCCTVAVKVCANPVKFVASPLNSTRYCKNVFVAVGGVTCPGA